MNDEKKSFAYKKNPIEEMKNQELYLAIAELERVAKSGKLYGDDRLMLEAMRNLVAGRQKKGKTHGK